MASKKERRKLRRAYEVLAREVPEGLTDKQKKTEKADKIKEASLIVGMRRAQMMEPSVSMRKTVRSSRPK